MTTETQSETGTTTPAEPLPVNGQTELNNITSGNDVVLVDFYADWCGPCQMLEPVVETLAADTDATVAKIDVDENQDLAAAHGVQGVPTLILFADGEPVEEVVGLKAEDELRALIETYTE